jgi:hypothetical protein
MNTFVITLDRNDGTERARRSVRAEEARLDTTTGALLFFEGREGERQTVASFADGAWSRFFRVDAVPNDEAVMQSEADPDTGPQRRRRRRGE